ncbi:MAG: hypothetical protein QMD36_00315 [Candidatus Aenigmarchaeota archaeon]|nr:hypothetical protein [Candidatus Aenigmarchaeota archaeon]
MVVFDVLMNFLNSIADFLPKLIGAIILLVFGWVIGWFVGKITKEIIRRAKIDEYIFKGKKPVFRLGEIFPLIFSWTIYLLFIWSAVKELGVEALSMAMETIVMGFLPGLIKAVIIVIAGYALAEYVRRQLESSNLMYSHLVGRFLFFLMIYLSVALALPLVGIDPFVVNMLLLLIVASVGIGLAIAIGLGLKDVVRDWAKKYQKSKK